jgi:hypothetical protein
LDKGVAERITRRAKTLPATILLLLMIFSGSGDLQTNIFLRPGLIRDLDRAVFSDSYTS